MPMISSLLTLLVRQRVSPLGLLLSLAASIRSLRPSSRPDDCGPRRPLPPEKPTRSKPILVYRQRFSTGGTSAAASIKRRDVVLLADLDEFLVMDLPLGIGEVEEEHHRRPLVDRFLELLAGLDLDHRHARVADGVVVADAVRLLHEDLVLHAGACRAGGGSVSGSLAGHAGRRGQRERRGAARGHQGRLAVEQLGDPLAHGVVQVVDADVLARGDLHRGHDLGPHQRPGQGRERAGRVDERADAQLLDHVACRRAASWATAADAADEQSQAGHAGQGTTGRSDAWSGSRLIFSLRRSRVIANAFRLAIRAGPSASICAISGSASLRSSRVEPAVPAVHVRASEAVRRSGRRWSSRLPSQRGSPVAR